MRTSAAAGSLGEHIEVTPGVAGGKLRIAGHRITVMDIAIWHDRIGHSPYEIATEYGLSLADVYAALAYYHDHRAEIDEQMRAGQEFAEALRQQIPSKIQG
jgi:uncharacterized protein (DUF433 family)